MKKEERFEKVVEDDKSYLFISLLLLLSMAPSWIDVVFRIEQLSLGRIVFSFVIVFANCLVSWALIGLYFDERIVYWRKIK